jgi:hypothetical protein
MDLTTREESTARGDTVPGEGATPHDAAASSVSPADVGPGERTYLSAVRNFIVRNLGRIALIVYLGILVAYTARNGMPTDRVDQTIWIVAAIVAAKLGKPWRLHVRAILDWTPLLAALLVYDYTRGIADTLGMPIRVSELVDAERFIFGGTVPTVWLQERLYVAGETRWYDVVAGITYMSHFVLPWVLAGVFYMVAKDRWWRYIRMVLLLSYAGLLTYIMAPAAPPWYASRAGVIADEVHRNAAAGWWDVIGIEFASRWFSWQQAEVNQVAALPSLHAGFALLVSVALWPVVKHWALRVPLAAFPLAMAFTLVYGGEHYVVDVLLGWTYVAAIVVGLRWWDRWWSELESVGADVAAGNGNGHGADLERVTELPVAAKENGNGRGNGHAAEFS